MGLRDLFSRRNRGDLIPVIEPLRRAEQDWITAQIKIANLYIVVASDELLALDPHSEAAEKIRSDAQAKGLADVVSLEHLAADWQSRPAIERPDVNDLVNSLGVAVGEHIRLGTGLTWVIAVDSNGSELALHATIGDILICPQNLVAKRIVAGESGFVGPLIERSIAYVKQVLLAAQ